MNEYADFKNDDVPADERFAALTNMVEQIRQKEMECEQAALALKKAQEELRDMNARQLPGLMDELGLEEFKTKSGLKVEVREEIEAGISQANKNDAHKWLDENGHSGLIKRAVLVAFNRDQTEDAKKLAQDLAAKYAAVTTDTRVHPSTLKAWVKEMLGNGKFIPEDTFGIFRRRVAKIHEAKK